MRDFIIKRFALSYDVKLFGTNFRYLRAVLPTLFFFCIAGLYTTLQEYQSVTEFTWIDLVLWTPVLICVWIGFKWFGIGYFGLNPVKYDELQDWEQQFQYIHAPYIVTKQWVNEKDYPEFERMYAEKYLGKEKFVNPVLGFAPFAMIIITGILFYILA